MKPFTIFSAVLVALSPVGAAVTDTVIGPPGHKGVKPKNFTFNLPVLPGMPAGLYSGSEPAATLTINTSGFNSTSLASLGNTIGQVPTAAEMAIIHDQVQDYIYHIDTKCDRQCCLALCLTIIWIPVVGLACGMSLFLSILLLFFKSLHRPTRCEAYAVALCKKTNSILTSYGIHLVAGCMTEH